MFLLGIPNRSEQQLNKEKTFIRKTKKKMTGTQPVVKPLFSILYLTENPDSASQTTEKERGR